MKFNSNLLLLPKVSSKNHSKLVQVRERREKYPSSNFVNDYTPLKKDLKGLEGH
jgi:hypothetical protein